METNIEKALNNFVQDPELQAKMRQEEESKKRVIKSDKSIIERIDRIIIAENGKQLLREWY